MKLSGYVTQVINDPKYGHDAEWVRLNLRREHLERIEDAHDAEVRKAGYDEAMKESAQCGPRGVVAEEPDWETTTERGFGLTTIPVANYRGMAPVDFTVQMSSLASEAKVWVGLEDHRAHMSVEEATRARDALSAFLAAVKQEGAENADSQ